MSVVQRERGEGRGEGEGGSLESWEGDRADLFLDTVAKRNDQSLDLCIIYFLVRMYPYIYFHLSP